MGRADAKPWGNGVLLWFDRDLRRGDRACANPNARHRDIWLRDPDGYVVVIAGK